MAPDGALEHLRDVAGKAAENAARIAAVLTLVDKPDASTIEAQAMTAGCELMTWYVGEAPALFWRASAASAPAQRNQTA